MKTEKDLLESRRARLNQVIRHSVKLREVANREWCAPQPCEKQIAEMRDLANNILQATHEYSAYSTAIEDIAPEAKA